MSKPNEGKAKSMPAGQNVQKKSGQPAAKRTHSEVSNTSAEELTIIQQNLDTMNENLVHLRGELNTLLKKEDIEKLISDTVVKIMEKMEQKMMDTVNVKLKGKTKELQDKIDGLQYENAQLKTSVEELSTKLTKTLEGMEEQIKNNKTLAQAANKRTNYNEQYSRKNNVKILNVPAQQNETEESLTTSVTNILHAQGVELEKQDVFAIHRIPGKRGLTKPVLLKLKNNNAKSAIMKKRKEMKNAGYRLIDDVTKLNQGLINRLSLHEEIGSAWFFNGSVYGRTLAGKRHKFDIYDVISSVIA